MKAAAYLRCSTTLQADSHGTDAQRAAIEGWMLSHGRDDARWFEDLAVSGKTMRRPQWLAMLAAVRAGQIDTIVTYSLSRAGRSLADLCIWTNEMVERGVRVVFLKENIDLGTPTGRLMLHLLGSVAEYEREITAERASDGIRARLSKGEKWGGARRVDRSVNGCAKATPAEWAAALRRVDKGEKVAAVAADLGVSEWAVRKRRKPA